VEFTEERFRGSAHRKSGILLVSDHRTNQQLTGNPTQNCYEKQKSKFQ
jgi:hypothetical protein